MDTCSCVVDLEDAKYEIRLDPNQLRRRSVGDLITAEITSVTSLHNNQG